MQRKMLATTSKVFRVARGEDDNNDDEDEDEDEDNDEDEDKDDEEDAKGVGKKRGLNEEDVLGPPWVEPNRHCTLMFYLNDVPSGGGETTFPLAKGAPPLVALPSGRLATEAPPGSSGAVGAEEGACSSDEAGNAAATTCDGQQLVVPPVRHEGMPECSRGLRVRPFRGGGALFYHKRGDGANDELSSHGGCPPLPSATADDEVVAWKINGFMWNTDSDRGPRYFRS